MVCEKGVESEKRKMRTVKGGKEGTWQRKERQGLEKIETCPWESTKVRELHWHPRLTKGEAAFRSFVRLRAEEPAASRVIARKFIFVIVFVGFLVGFGVGGVD